MLKVYKKKSRDNLLQFLSPFQPTPQTAVPFSPTELIPTATRLTSLRQVLRIRLQLNFFFYIKKKKYSTFFELLQQQASKA